MDVNEDGATCPAWSPSARRRCGRPIKRDGKCGLHAAAVDRREANDARWAREAQERRDRNRAREAKVGHATNLAMILTDALGVPFDVTSYGLVTLTIEDAEKLRAKLGLTSPHEV